MDLFSDQNLNKNITLGNGAQILGGIAAEHSNKLFVLCQSIIDQSPLRQLVTPGGKTMSVEMSNCGHLGWHSDRQGYRYTRLDPLTRRPWPAMPALFKAIARNAANSLGFNNFTPDACLVNRYSVGSRLHLHQDQDEEDKISPIVSVSLGLSGTFLFGGLSRESPCQRHLLNHGDVVVWGGKSRFVYHGVEAIKPGHHPLTGAFRYNLTFRKVKA